MRQGLPATVAFWLALLLLWPAPSPARQPPVTLHPDNSHYFLIRDKPTLLRAARAAPPRAWRA